MLEGQAEVPLRGHRDPARPFSSATVHCTHHVLIEVNPQAFADDGGSKDSVVGLLKRVKLMTFALTGSPSALLSVGHRWRFHLSRQGVCKACSSLAYLIPFAREARVPRATRSKKRKKRKKTLQTRRKQRRPSKRQSRKRCAFATPGPQKQVQCNCEATAERPATAPSHVMTPEARHGHQFQNAGVMLGLLQEQKKAEQASKELIADRWV